MMDKFGVKIDKDKEKEAKATKSCPSCGGALTSDIPHCGTCGTKPFESNESEEIKTK